MFDNSYLKVKRNRLLVKKKVRQALKTGNMYQGRTFGDASFETIEYNGVIYSCEPVYIRIVDSYGSDGSVEAFHHEFMGYSRIRTYFGDVSELDFRFVKLEDNIEMKFRNNNIKKIKLNSQNLRNAFFMFSKNDDYCNFDNKIDFDIFIDSNPIDMLISLKYFLTHNSDIIGSINFINVKYNVMERMISEICFRSNQFDISFVTEERDKIYIKR